MKWRDALQRAYRSINRGLDSGRSVLETRNHNFFRLKSMLYVFEAMLMVNKSGMKMDEDLTPKIRVLHGRLSELQLSNTCPILYSRFLIISSWVDKASYYPEAMESALAQNNKLDAEWAKLLNSLSTKEFSYMRLKTSGHPSNPHEWLGYVRVSGMVGGNSEDKNDGAHVLSDTLRDTAPIHFFPYCPQL